MKKNIIRLLLFSAGLILLFYTVTFFGLENITLPNKIAWLPFWGAILITVVMISTLAERWRLVVLSLLPTTNIPREGFYQIIGTTLIGSHLIPKEVADFGGKAMWLIKTKKVPIMKAGSSILLDRLLDIWILLITFPIAIIYVKQSLLSTNLLNILIVGFIAIIFLPIFFNSGNAINFLFKRIRNIGFDFINRWFHRRLGSGEEEIYVHFSKNTMAKLVLLSIFKFAMLSFRNVLFALIIFSGLPPDILIAGTPLSQATFIFSFTAGGLGVLEAGWLAILNLAKQDPSLIINFILAQRVFTILSDCSASILVVAFCQIYKKSKML